MSCNDNHIHNHRLWFTNGTIATNLQPQCRDLFIPVEKIDKQNPAGQTTATIGVPFTYTLTMPVMWDPITGTVISDQGSLDDLHGITVIDDLNESAAQLTYVSHADLLGEQRHAAGRRHGLLVHERRRAPDLGLRQLRHHHPGQASRSSSS